MAHSIELLLDAECETAIRRIWTDLAEAGLPSQLSNKSPSNRPHVSVVVAENIDGDVDEMLRPLVSRLPIPCVIGAPLLFGGPRLTVARLVVPSADLVWLQADIHEVCRRFLSPEPMTHTCPGEWTPHVTLCRRMRPDQLAFALAEVHALTREIPGELVSMRRWNGDERSEHLIG